MAVTLKRAFESYRLSWGPSWLKGPYGSAWQRAHGQIADELVYRLKCAVASSFPMECPADALPYLGSEIGIPRSPADSDDDYRVKLRRAWELWPFAGTPLGMLLAFEAAGYAAGQVVLVQQEAHGFSLNTNTALDPDQRLVQYDLAGGRWNFDGTYTLWNRFGVLFPDPNNLPTGWAAGAASPPTTLTTPTLDEVNGMIRLVNKWRRSAAIFQWIRVCTSGLLWGWPPDMAWGDPGLVWGGTMVEWGPAEY
jgi:hypothetical protein